MPSAHSVPIASSFLLVHLLLSIRPASFLGYLPWLSKVELGTPLLCFHGALCTFTLHHAYVQIGIVITGHLACLFPLGHEFLDGSGPLISCVPLALPSS